MHWFFRGSHSRSHFPTGTKKTAVVRRQFYTPANSDQIKMRTRLTSIYLLVWITPKRILLHYYVHLKTDCVISCLNFSANMDLMRYSQLSFLNFVLAHSGHYNYTRSIPKAGTNEGTRARKFVIGDGNKMHCSSFDEPHVECATGPCIVIRLTWILPSAWAFQ